MGVVRWLGRWAGTGLLLVAFAPTLALIPSMLLDRGPSGEVRATVFPLALAALDPFIRECAENSLAVAAIVAASSFVAGLGLAQVIATRRFWGRVPLAALVFAPIAFPPFLGALGLKLFFGPFVERGETSGFGSSGGWVCWIWVGVATGAPTVALAASWALARVEPAWVDAAALAGASRWQVWRHHVWPIVRPGAAKAAALVFTLTLIEPGAPLILGLRRTLSFQIVEAVLGPDPFPRATVLTLIAVGLAAAVRVMLRWWGGHPIVSLSEVPVARARRASWLRAAVCLAMLGAGTALGLIPILNVIAAGLAPAPWASTHANGWSAAAAVRWVDDPLSRQLVVNSLALGLAVTLIDLALARSLASWTNRRTSFGSAAGWLEAFPPLAIGVGALALPWLCTLAADALATTAGASSATRLFRACGEALDPYRTPGVLLTVAVAAAQQSYLARAVAASRARMRPVLSDAALNLGAKAPAARRLASGNGLGAPAGALILTFALAATNLTPALLLAPTAESRPLAPSILILADQPGDGRTRAAGLATVAILLNVLAFGFASRGHLGLIAEGRRNPMES